MCVELPKATSNTQLPWRLPIAKWPFRLVLELPMSRRDISDSLGLTIETVSRQLSKLRDDGVIETVGRSGVILNAVESLRDRAGFLREAA